MGGSFTGTSGGLGAGLVRSSPVIGADGVIYFGTDPGSLAGNGSTVFCAINADGTKRWNLEVEGAVRAAAAVAADGTAYFGASDGLFRAVNSNGTVRWE